MVCFLCPKRSITSHSRIFYFTMFSPNLPLTCETWGEMSWTWKLLVEKEKQVKCPSRSILPVYIVVSFMMKVMATFSSNCSIALPKNKERRVRVTLLKERPPEDEIINHFKNKIHWTEGHRTKNSLYKKSKVKASSWQAITQESNSTGAREGEKGCPLADEVLSLVHQQCARGNEINSRWICWQTATIHWLFVYS